jgi:hypothetical protein
MALPSRHALCHSSGKFCHFLSTRKCHHEDESLIEVLRIKVNNVGKNEYSSLSEYKKLGTFNFKNIKAIFFLYLGIEFQMSKISGIFFEAV